MRRYAPGAPTVTVDKSQFSRLYDYGSVVTFAAGAFNWRVAAGDRTRVEEFTAGQIRLASETSEQEMTWSRSSPVSVDQLKAWFGKQFKIVETAAEFWDQWDFCNLNEMFDTHFD